MADEETTGANLPTVVQPHALSGVPWAPQQSPYIPFNVQMPDGHTERVLVDAGEVWDVIMAKLPRWLDPNARHTFGEAQLRTTVKAGVKIARSLMLEKLFSSLPPGYPQPPNSVAKGQDYLLVLARYLYGLFVDIQAATGGVTARVERNDGAYRVADVTLPDLTATAAAGQGAANAATTPADAAG